MNYRADIDGLRALAVISVTPCDEFAEADVPMQFDEGHLTVKGAAEVGRRLAASFGRTLARANDVSD
jgi:hypothetical protein